MDTLQQSLGILGLGVPTDHNLARTERLTPVTDAKRLDPDLTRPPHPPATHPIRLRRNGDSASPRSAARRLHQIHCSAGESTDTHTHTHTHTHTNENTLGGRVICSDRDTQGRYTHGQRHQHTHIRLDTLEDTQTHREPHTGRQSHHIHTEQMPTARQTPDTHTHTHTHTGQHTNVSRQT